MSLSYHYSVVLTAVSIGVPLIEGLDLSNPLVLLFLFLLFDVFPSAVAGFIMSAIGVSPEDFTPSTNSKLAFYLYPLYPIFFPMDRYGLAEVVTWTVFFFPIFEEVLFFSAPALYGFVTGNYSMAYSMCLICGTFWVAIHLFRNVSRMLSAGYTPKQIVIATVAGLIAYAPHVILASILWISGMGAISILFHSVHNALSIVGSIVETKEREFANRLASRLSSRIHSKIGSMYKPSGKYYVIRKRKYYVLSE